ncbi:MAG: radical SAM protein [Elusimicrobia bacterium]|nr:radical SAM protein [Elusimicrobiota bacterium]
MASRTKQRPRLLLSSVFGPYGVDDQYGRRENIMELSHNQVTREQGLFSPRVHNESYCLHLLAQNVDVPSTVLDFPSEQRFVKELKKGYDYLGISFIMPNFVKAKRMAELARRHAPGTKIILGGHGTAIDGVESAIPCDHICRGDGVGFLRGLFGPAVTAPIRHPMMEASFNRYVMGIPIDGRVRAAVVLSGVGCVNGCRFCCTSHFFDKRYIPFLDTGKETFDLCRKLEAAMGITDFSVMDENFLKHETRARDLLALMEKHGKPYTFSLFSSAEVVRKVGLGFLQRLGVEFLWMGVESKRALFEKNRGADFVSLVRDLRGQGINVLTSGILFLEHHDKASIHEDIDFMVSLDADFVQFMQLGPAPGTQLYFDYRDSGKLIQGVPYEEWHGQGRIWFRHPHFTPAESEDYLRKAFQKDFAVNGPSILRMADTVLRGARATAGATDPFLKLRHQVRRRHALRHYPLLGPLVTFAPNARAKQLACRVLEDYRRFFGPPSLGTRLKSAAAHVLMVKEMIREKLVAGNLRQPPTIVTTYRPRAG